MRRAGYPETGHTWQSAAFEAGFACYTLFDTRWLAGRRSYETVATVTAQHRRGVMVVLEETR